MYVTMFISIGSYPNLNLWNANKLHYITYSCHLNPELKVNIVYLCGFQGQVMATCFSNYMANSPTTQPNI